MKKICICAFSLFVSVPMAYGQNVMFGPDAKNSFSLYVSNGTDCGSLFKIVNPFDWRYSPMNLIMIGYSQPMELLRLPGRVNVNAMQNIAYGSAHGLSFMGIGISWDIAFLNWHGFYVGAGLGPYMRDNRDRWVSSRLFFGEKFFIGKNINDDWRIEFMTTHFSNGDLTETNFGFNFVGFSVNYSF